MIPFEDTPKPERSGTPWCCPDVLEIKQWARDHVSGTSGINHAHIEASLIDIRGDIHTLTEEVESLTSEVAQLRKSYWKAAGGLAVVLGLISLVVPLLASYILHIYG